MLSVSQELHHLQLLYSSYYLLNILIKDKDYYKCTMFNCIKFIITLLYCFVNIVHYINKVFNAETLTLWKYSI